MKLISHRGNLDKPGGKLGLYSSATSTNLYGLIPENSIELIKNRILEDYDVEVDIFVINNKIYLGHDGPQEEIDKGFLEKYSARLLLHLKNPEALAEFRYSQSKFHYFAHDKDPYTISSFGIPICYPGICPVPNSILMKCENFYIPQGLPLYGLCSDYISYYKENV